MKGIKGSIVSILIVACAACGCTGAPRGAQRPMSTDEQALLAKLEALSPSERLAYVKTIPIRKRITLAKTGSAAFRARWKADILAASGGGK